MKIELIDRAQAVPLVEARNFTSNVERTEVGKDVRTIT